MKKLTAVFWDVDGTIADTELGGHRVAFNLAFKDYELDWYWDENIYLRLLEVSGGLNRIIHYRNTANKLVTDNICSKIQSRKSFHYKKLVESGHIHPRVGVLRLINELASNNVKQFIVTTSGKKSLIPLLNTLLKNYLKYFTQMITYEDVKRHKPFPDAYQLALSLCKESPSNCLVIEDSAIGVEAAKKAKLKCLLTLPPWNLSIQKISKDANACVDCLGNKNHPSNLIYGHKLLSNKIDFLYLTNLIN